MKTPISKWIYVLVGNDRTGKTTFQKSVIKIMCDKEYDRLHCNKVFDITHRDAPRRFRSLSVINRSFQETRENYGTVEKFFTDHFQPADVNFLSSHTQESDIADITEMIKFAKRRYYNVGLVLFTNALNPMTERISEELGWDERFLLENPHLENGTQINSQIYSQIYDIAHDFCQLILRRMNHQ